MYKTKRFFISCLLLCISNMLLMATETTLASWTFDTAYDTSVSGNITTYTPNTSEAANVTGWFNSITPKILPNTYTGTQTDYVCSALSTGRYFQFCSGYNNRVMRIENNTANEISDYTDGSQQNVYYELTFPTLSYKDIKINYAMSCGNNTACNIIALVSTDNGATWVNAGSNACRAAWWIYDEKTVSISAQNKAKVIVRLMAENGYATNWNLDFVNIKGTYSTEFKKQYSLATSVNIAGAGTVTTSPSGTELDEGTEVTLTATPNFGYHFVNWTDNSTSDVLGTNKTCKVTMSKAQSITANFEAVATYELQYSVEGVSSNHLVSVSPAPTVVDGKKMYETGTEVTLTASDNDVLSFLYWDGGAASSKAYKVNMSENKNVVATYKGNDYIVGWDLVVQTPKTNRTADFYADADNKGLLYLTNDGTNKKGWLSHTGWAGHPCAISWQNIADKYYFQWQFATTGKKDVSVKLTASAINYSRYTSYNVQYSTDNTSWTTLDTYDFSTNTGWATKTVALPEAANNKEVVYVRLCPAAEATVAGSGNDCIAVTDIFVTYVKAAEAEDTTAPQLQNSLPADNATNVSTSGSFILTFDENIALNEGAYATLDGDHIVPTINGNLAIFQYSALAFASNYTFSLPANSIKDIAGNNYADAVSVTFTTAQRTQPAAKLYDVVVAKDGTGDYTTIQAAVDAAPSNRATPYLIFIKAGQYEEHIDIPAAKTFLHFIGEGRNLVSIEDNKLEGALGKVVPTKAEYELQPDGTAFSVYDGATVVCQAANVYFEGINFVNTYGRDENNGPQALALFANCDRFTLNKCGLISFQDTYLTAWNSQASRQYVKNSWIEGAVDFIYGGGDVYFDQDTINVVRKDGGYIVAPSHTAESKWGYVFDHNVITSTIVSDPTQTKCYFGRPWTNEPKTVFLHTQCEISTYDGIWYDHMGGLPSIWAVYDMKDKDGNAMSTTSISQYYKTVDGNKVYGTAKNSLTDEEAAAYTVKSVMRGNDAWQPELLCEAIAAPSVTVSNGTITWDAVDYAICYAILKNGKVQSFTTSTSYVPTDKAFYSVKAVNEYGGLSEASAQVATMTLGQNGYSTFSPEYDCTISGAKAYRAEYNGSAVILKEVSAIPAGAGVVLKGNEGDNVTVNKSADAAAITNNALVGVNASTTSILSGSNYVLASNGTQTAFIQMATDKTVADMMGKAYLHITASDAKSISIVFEDDATGIRDINATTVANSPLYNLAGQRVTSEAKGVIIVNGVKVIK